MQDWLPWVSGAFGGIGGLCVWYGVARLRDGERERADRRRGLWLVNGGVVLMAASLLLLGQATG